MTAKSLGRNSAYAVMVQGWRIGTQIILMPLIIQRLGLEGYGTWTLLFAICSYINLTETSFGLAYAKLTAEYDARRDYRGLNQIIGSGVALVGLLSLVGLAALWIWRERILALFGVPQTSLEDAGQALILVSICAAMRMSFGCVFQILAGLQRLDLQYKAGILSSAVQFGVQLWLLFHGWGLLGLALGHFAGQVAGTGLAWGLCRFLCPALRISPLNISRAGLRRIGTLGGKFQLVSVLQLIALQGSRLAISGLIDVATLAIFEIAHKLLSLGAIAGSAVIAPLMPAFANLHASDTPQRWQSLYHNGSRMVSAICIPTFAFLAILADPLIFIWTGEHFPLAAWTIRYLGISFYASLLTGVITSSLRGRGMVRLEMGYGVVSTVVFFALLLPANWIASYKGVVLAFNASSILGSAWLLIVFSRQESIALKQYLRETVLQPLLIFLPAMAVMYMLLPVMELHVEFITGRKAVLLDLVPWMGLFTLVVATATWFGLLSPRERELVGRTASRLTTRLGFKTAARPQ